MSIPSSFDPRVSGTGHEPSAKDAAAAKQKSSADLKALADLSALAQNHIVRGKNENFKDFYGRIMDRNQAIDKINTKLIGAPINKILARISTIRDCLQGIRSNEGKDDKFFAQWFPCFVVSNNYYTMMREQGSPSEEKALDDALTQLENDLKRTGYIKSDEKG